MSENDINHPNQSLASRLIVIALISIVIVITILAGKKATNKQGRETFRPTPSIITPTPSIAQKEVAAEERCFINLNGKSYDVSDFKKEEEGGEIFVCGADMSEKFKTEEEKDFARFKKYEVDEQGNFINKN